MVDLEERTENRQIMTDAMQSLKRREADIVYRREVLGETLRAIGDDYGISQKRTRDICLHAIRKMRLEISRGRHIFAPSQGRLPRKEDRGLFRRSCSESRQAWEEAMILLSHSPSTYESSHYRRLMEKVFRDQ